MTDEWHRIEKIRAAFETPTQGLVIGIGDDGAVLEGSTFPEVWSVDSAVEGVHFLRTWLSPDEIGARAFACAASDLSAMGAHPRAALVALHLPKDTSEDAFDALIAGLQRASDAARMPIVGGNLSSAGAWIVSITVIGQARGAILRRGGAREGDGVYVTGRVGAAALGLRALERGANGDLWKPFIDAWKAPMPRLPEGIAIGAFAHACIDVSDGLLQDLGHLCDASQLSARIDVEALPLLPTFSDAARALGEDPLQLALTGGEDYELLFCAPDTPAARSLGTRIGTMVAPNDGAPRPYAIDARGNILKTPHPGFSHF